MKKSSGASSWSAITFLKSASTEAFQEECSAEVQDGGTESAPGVTAGAFASPRVDTGRTVFGTAPDDALPRYYFLQCLRREKRRSERSQSPLSVVLYRNPGHQPQDAINKYRFIERLASQKRETDILGHVSDDAIAVLCPDTNEAGVEGFMRKLHGQDAMLGFTVQAATYPNQLFDQLAGGAASLPAMQPLLVFDQSDRHRGSYPLKRSLDIVGAIAVLCLLGPLMAAVALAILLTSRGPIIFRQTRLGRGGVPFTFYKFRSMTIDGDDGIHRAFVAKLIAAKELETVAVEGCPAPYKLQRDPRITAVGRFIRKTSIDELPQFYNVLKGDMSIVGPRPPIPYETAHYQTWHLRRVLGTRPGITGLWQVQGRSKVTFNEMVRMDLRYIRDCSLLLDLKIMVKTIAVVIRCAGAS